jgi:hypothetical protein
VDRSDTWVVSILPIIWTPDLVQELAMGQHLSGVLNQIGWQFELIAVGRRKATASSGD